MPWARDRPRDDHETITRRPRDAPTRRPRDAPTRLRPRDDHETSTTRPRPRDHDHKTTTRRPRDDHGTTTRRPPDRKGLPWELPGLHWVDPAENTAPAQCFRRIRSSKHRKHCTGAVFSTSSLDPTMRIENTTQARCFRQVRSTIARKNTGY